MSFSYRVLSLAANELLEAAFWYDHQRSGLGDELILNFEATLHNILRDPLACQTRFNGLRLANTSRFPYQIIYYVEEKMITIIAFQDSKKSPQHRKRRNKKK